MGIQASGYCLFLNAGNVTKGGFRFAECQFISAEKDKKLNKGKLTRGDVVLTTRGTVGNLSHYTDEVPFDHIRINSGMVILRNTSSTVANAYQYLVLRSRIVESQIERLSFGSAQPQLTVRGISTLQIPLPPTKAEQEAIAEALSDADALIESLGQLIVKKRQIKQGAMQWLLSPPETTPIENGKLKMENEEGGTRNSDNSQLSTLHSPYKKRLPGFSGEWEVRRLGDVAEIVMGQSPSSSHYNNKGDGLPLIQGNADIANRKTIKRVFTTEITKRGRRGDILMSVRAPVGEISRAIFDVCLGRGVCAIRYANDFLYHSLIAKESTWAKLSKGSTFDSVNSTDVKAFKIGLPIEYEEQIAIATIFSDMDAEIAALEAKLAKARQVKQGMMQELLTGKTRLV
jgi:type I restriction enzyme S subunit